MPFAGSEINQSTVGLQEVATQYYDTYTQLKHHQVTFERAAQTVQGVNSQATVVLKGIVSSQLIPDVQRILTIFEGLGEGIQQTRNHAETAQANAGDAVSRFRGQLGG